jgi:hypothetical protein
MRRTPVCLRKRRGCLCVDCKSGHSWPLGVWETKCNYIVREDPRAAGERDRESSGTFQFRHKWPDPRGGRERADPAICKAPAARKPGPRHFPRRLARGAGVHTLWPDVHDERVQFMTGKSFWLGSGGQSIISTNRILREFADVKGYMTRKGAAASVDRFDSCGIIWSEHRFDSLRMTFLRG